jgi:hypothetical protein
MGTIIILMRWNAKKFERYNRHSTIFCSNHFCLTQILNNFDNGHLLYHNPRLGLATKARACKGAGQE